MNTFLSQAMEEVEDGLETDTSEEPTTVEDKPEVPEGEGKPTTTGEVEEAGKKTNVHAKREDELVFYCTITNFEGLKEAHTKEKHEQWNIKTSRGSLRVRKTIKDTLNPSFDKTYKTKSMNAGIAGNTESPYTILEEEFEDFKGISESGMVKDRYKFPVSKITVTNAAGVQEIEVTDTFYEVDVFFNDDGTYNENVKIDLELNELLEQINSNHPDLGDFNLNVKITQLPFKPSNVIIDKEATDTERKFINNLYDTVFLTKR